MISEMLSGNTTTPLRGMISTSPSSSSRCNAWCTGVLPTCSRPEMARLVEILAGQEIERDDLLLDVLVGLGDQGAVLDRRLPDRVVRAHVSWRAAPQAGASLQAAVVVRF